MAKVRRGGYTFLMWKGDHDPKHVHVFKDGKQVLKWNLENSVVISGTTNKKLRKLIKLLVTEGKL